MRRTGAWRTDREQASGLVGGVQQESGKPRVCDEKVIRVREIRKPSPESGGSDYALGKAAESLTDGQRARLDIIRKDDPRLCRTYCLKEFLHLLLKTTDLTHAESDLKHGLWWTSRSSIPAFKEPYTKIKRR